MLSVEEAGDPAQGVESTFGPVPDRQYGPMPEPGSVSVVVATYNRAELLPRAIESVLAQDHAPLELVVVDDGSTDHTVEVLEAYAERVRWTTQANAERGAARNVGARMATGDLLCFLDSDDEMLPGHVGKLVAALREHPESGLAYTEAEFHDDRTGAPFDVFPRRPLSGDALVQEALGNVIALGSSIVRRDVFDRAGGFVEDRTLSGCEDWELWVRCCALTPLTFVPGPTVRIHFHDQNTVGNPVAMERAITAAVSRMFDGPLTAERLAPHRRRARAGMWAFLAHNHMLAGDGRAARRRLLTAVREDPLAALQPVWFTMALKAIVGVRAIRRLREVRRRRHLRRRATSSGPLVATGGR